MENREIFSNLATFSPVFVRLDGRAFHALTRKSGFAKPFDDRFCKAMVGVCRSLVGESGLTPAFAYTFSDEISLYLKELPFSGRVEKIDSVAASYAASALTLILGAKEPLAFDARIVQATPESAVEYMTGRQDEAWRNHLNAYCQQALIAEGMDATAAAGQAQGDAGTGAPRDDVPPGRQPRKDAGLAAPGGACLQKGDAKRGLQPDNKRTCDRHAEHGCSRLRAPAFYDTGRTGVSKETDLRGIGPAPIHLSPGKAKSRS